MKEMLPTVNLDEGAGQCSPRAPPDEASRPVRAGKVDLRIFHFRICGPDLGAVGEMRLDGDEVKCERSEELFLVWGHTTLQQLLMYVTFPDLFCKIQSQESNYWERCWTRGALFQFVICDFLKKAEFKKLVRGALSNLSFVILPKTRV